MRKPLRLLGEPLETAGGLIQALPVLGSEPFMVVNGDIWLRYDFALLRTALGAGQLAHLLLVDNPVHHPKGDFALAGPAQPGQVQALLPEAETRLTFAGVSVLSPELFAGLAPGKQPLAPLLRAAIAAGRATGEYLAGPWVDVGTPERLKSLDLSIRSGHI